MRKAILTILLLLTLTLMLPIIALTSPQSSLDSVSAFGLDLEVSYSGLEVEAML